MAGRRRPKVRTYFRDTTGLWSVIWRENGRQIEERGYESEDEAQDRADEIRQRIRTGLPGVREPRTIGFLVAHWINSYVDTDSIEASTRQGYMIDARRILESIGSEDAHTTTGKIRKWRNDIAKQHGPRAANKAHTALSSAYERALEADPPMVEANPCRGISRLAEPAQARVTPTRLHVEYLERTAPSKRELAILMLASRAGTRRSETFGLSWANVSEKAIHVAEVSDPVTRQVRRSTKTKRSERRVPIPPSTRAALSAIRPARASGLVFPSPTDSSRPVSRSAWLKTYWNRWILAAVWEAASNDEPEDVWGPLLEMQFKFLRHHAISRWAAGGATITQVSRWSGDSIATIDKHYAYLFDEDEDDVMSAVD